MVEEDILLVSNRGLLLVLGFSVLSVWSHWNLFSDGVVVLGLNASLFWIGVAVVLCLVDNSYGIRRDWMWLCPIALMGLSYSLYENPWLKLITLFLLPIMVGVFCAYSHVNDRREMLWNGQLLRAIGVRFFKPLSAMDQVMEGLFDRSLFPSGLLEGGVIGRILRGVLFLVPLSLLVISLLSSADAKFGEIVLHGVRATFDAMSWLTLWKFTLSLLLAIALLSMATGWRGVIVYSESSDTKTIDGLVAGIVLGGLLTIYIAFLSLQLDNLVVETLPENYREAELMVKSGFWQLFLLAVLNTGLFFIVYKKTGWAAQWVLRVFIIASSLLMVSAAWKVWLYSRTFGLSYEKFFACYTAVFALGVLLYLVAASFSHSRRNVVKVIAFAALWGYSVATISPVEKMIFHANLYFAEQEDTRITLSQLTQLSLDILTEVNEVYPSQLVREPEDIAVWRNWKWQQKHTYCERPWYEKNLSVLTACSEG